MNKLEITIPVLDEEQTLDRQVRKAIQFIQNEISHPFKIGLVIADNGSTDRTSEIASELCREFSQIRYIRLDERGVGRALKASWESSDADIVGYMDLDLATDLSSLNDVLNIFTNDRADFITGTRLHRDSRVIGRSILRTFTSRLFNMIVRFYMGTNFSDGMCGFKFLKRIYYNKLRDLGSNSDGWIFATEILICAEKYGLIVFDLPVMWTDDPNSKVNIVKLSMEYLKALANLKKKLPVTLAELNKND